MATQNDLINYYTAMQRIRRVEEKLAEHYSDQEIRCPMHLCIGQEAIAVGVSASLRNDDKVYSNHRAHGHYLAKGGNLNQFIAELYGRVTGCCEGRGGSMHLIDKSVGFMGSTPIVGGTVPLAVGTAWAASLKGLDQVTVVYFGDGCFEEGVMHESINFAVLHSLPIVFVCENNNYSVYTNIKQRQSHRPIYKVVEAHGVQSAIGNGNDVNVVVNLAAEAIQSAREESKPQFLEFKTHRWLEHCGPNFDDDLNYREVGELENWMRLCPIATIRSTMLCESIVDENDLLEIDNKIEAVIDSAFTLAKQDEIPSLSSIEESINAA